MIAVVGYFDFTLLSRFCCVRGFLFVVVVLLLRVTDLPRVSSSSGLLHVVRS
jgi:hypothetical protein